MKYKTIAKQRVPLFNFLALSDFPRSLFGLCHTFFRKLFEVSKGSPFNVFDILQHNGFLRPSFSRHYATFFPICFLLKPPRLLLETRICKYRGLLRGFRTMQHFPGDKNPHFFKMFFCFQLGKSVFRVISIMKGTLWVFRNCFPSFSKTS